MALSIFIVACSTPAASDPGGTPVFAGTSAFAGTGGATAGVPAAIPVAGTLAVAGSSGPMAGALGASALQGSAWPAAGGFCGDIGQDCSAKLCGPLTICSDGSSVCLPRPASAVSMACTPGTCPAGQPYCVAAHCMSAEDAVCACGYAAGKMRVDTCKTMPSAALGAKDVCFDEESLCSSAPQKCCPGLTCAQSPTTLGQCFKACTANGDCAGRCCGDTSAGKFCMPGTSC